MKWFIAILSIIGFAGLFSAATGIQHASYSSSLGSVVVYHDVGGRIIALIIGLIALLAAYGCARKKEYAWYIVVGLLWSALISEVWYALHATFTWDLPFPAIVLGLLGEAVKIGCLGWLIFRYWPRQRRSFKKA